MKKNQIDEQLIEIYVITLVKDKNIKTVDELVNLVQTKYPVPEKDLLELLLNLEENGKLNLKTQKSTTAPIILNYILSRNALWYWTIVVGALITLGLVLNVHENEYPLVYVRHFFGVIFMLFFPGYTLAKTLFPEQKSLNIERIVFSLGLSLVLVPITGFFLNFTPWGLGTIPVVFSLFFLTIILATAALIREYHAELKKVIS